MKKLKKTNNKPTKQGLKNTKDVRNQYQINKSDIVLGDKYETVHKNFYEYLREIME